MKPSAGKIIETLLLRYPVLEVCRASIFAAAEAVCECYRAGGKLMVCGNGGSAADAEHIVGELMKGFCKKRPLPPELRARLEAACPEDAAYLAANLQGALPALSLVNPVALTTAFANDCAPDLAMAQQVLGIGAAGDVLLAISTSGNSRNVVYAVETAHAADIGSIALTGRSGGRLKSLADITVAVPDDETYRVQELHLPVYHALCLAAEEEFFEA